jgi:hypothetical protein
MEVEDPYCNPSLSPQAHQTTPSVLSWNRIFGVENKFHSQYYEFYASPLVFDLDA